MKLSDLWQNDPKIIEIGVRDSGLASALRNEGFTKYLGVCRKAAQAAGLATEHPDLLGQLTWSNRRKLVLCNNADVLILSDHRMISLWKYRSVRHARWVAWPVGFNPFWFVALVGCLFHLVTKRFSWPRLVKLWAPGGKTKWLFTSRVLRQKRCRSESLHFIPQKLGLNGMFQSFDDRCVQYVVLRWFDALPEIEPGEDVDMLIADHSLSAVIEVLESAPGIQPCDLYSESGLARSAYCGMPYYPPRVARRILDGAVRHRDVCFVPNAWDHFHSLAYHAVYHKGTKSNLSRTGTGLEAKRKPEHDYAGILRSMADRLGISVDVSLEGLHRYLQQNSYAPPPEMLARLAVACWRSKWLRLLADRLPSYVRDQGLTVFVVREAAIQGGFLDQILRRVRESGFEVLETKTLAPHEIEFAAARTRGGNWDEGGPFDRSGGLPAAIIVAYDRQPITPNRRQRRRFPQRTNARIFIKESIRDAIIEQLPGGQSFNALHSSDHAAEAWHLIEVIAPELMQPVRRRLSTLGERDGDVRKAA